MIRMSFGGGDFGDGLAFSFFGRVYFDGGVGSESMPCFKQT